MEEKEERRCFFITFFCDSEKRKKISYFSVSFKYVKNASLSVGEYTILTKYEQSVWKSISRLFHQSCISLLTFVCRGEILRLKFVVPMVDTLSFGRTHNHPIMEKASPSFNESSTEHLYPVGFCICGPTMNGNRHSIATFV